MSVGHGTLDWLLPGTTREEREEAQRLVTFLRLLRDDARGRAAEAVGIDVGRAERELERTARARLLRAVAHLLTAHAQAALPVDAFEACDDGLGAPLCDLQEAWSVLERARAGASSLAPLPSGASIPTVPEPGESPAHVARRLFDAARKWGAGPDFCAVWPMRLARFEGDARELERIEARWSLLATRARAEKNLALEALAIRSRVRCMLERGAVSEARVLLDDSLMIASVDEELAWLCAWTALSSGDPARAEEFVRGRKPRSGRLPLALADLRRRVPEWAPLLPGEPAASGTRPAPGAARSCASLGVAGLAVLVVDEGVERPRIACFDLAPRPSGAARAQRSPVEETLERRRGAWLREGEPEHEAFRLGRTAVVHRRTARLECALEPARARAVAFVPMLAPGDESSRGSRRGPGKRPIGWVQVECAHHLLPSEERLSALARAWRDELGCTPRVELRSRTPASVRGAGAIDPVEGFRAGEGRALLERLPMRLARRRALLFDADEGLDCVASTGGAFEAGADRSPRIGAGLLRALRTRAPVHLERDFPGTFVGSGRGALGGAPASFQGARSGVVVPLAVAGRVHALLAVESTRAGDFAEDDRGRLVDFVAGEAISWRTVQFRAWHLRRFEFDPWLDLSAHAWRDRQDELLRTARAAGPVVVAGPAGSGKEVFARWLHFEGAAARDALATMRPHEELAAALGRAPASLALGGSWILDGAERWSSDELDLLFALLGEAPRTRAIALLPDTPPGPARASGSSADLGERFARRLAAPTLRVPALRDRRDEIRGLSETLARRAAAEAGTSPVRLSDDASAVLWRQPWEGDVRELERFVQRAVALGAAGEVDAQRLEAIAGRVPIRFARRLPSRSPRREDLELALFSTARANGTLNKKKAALFLGWDPDTLVIRMTEHGLV